DRLLLEGPMFFKFALACLLAAAPLAAAPRTPAGQQEEKPKPVPKDSIRVVITGCVRGRVIRAADVRQPDTTSGVSVRSKSFRLEGKRDVMKGIKAVDGSRAEVTGLIRKSALIQPGVNVMGGRVRIGGGPPTASGAGSLPDPAQDVVVLDTETVQAIGGSCGA
ncbi:MAG TPA: hypothetical protein VFZ98_05000, partial [Vicinamibacterales bacterium]